jgi:hypothetical protein
MQYQWLKPKHIAEDSNYPFTQGQLSHFLLNRHKNSLQKAVRKIGKCLYLRKDLFDAWIEAQAEKKRS